ncbi:MAG: ParB-like protein [Bdellovibrionales bacterium]
MKKPAILNFRPTQFVLGMKEIESKVEKMKGYNSKQMAAYCAEHVVPVVLGPNKQTYAIDHHHFLRACWEVEVEDYEIKVIKDLSDLSEIDFWNLMIKNDWVYLHDQFGLGPHSPLALPADIRCMADDPYRSLAWALRDQGFIKKIDTPFFEFQWAAFLRHNLEFKLHSKSNFDQFIKVAKDLAKSKSASHLPGYAFKK